MRRARVELRAWFYAFTASSPYRYKRNGGKAINQIFLLPGIPVGVTHP